MPCFRKQNIGFFRATLCAIQHVSQFLTPCSWPIFCCFGVVFAFSLLFHYSYSFTKYFIGKEHTKLNISNIYMLFTGLEVRIGRNCARRLEYRLRHRPRAVLGPRAQILTIRTDLGRWITFLFFSNWDLKVSGKFSFTLQPMCVKVGRVHVDERAIDCKPKQNIMIFGSVILIYYGAYCSLFLCLAR